ncbi:MAG: hypothetical protein A2268_15790 [Candidatus Raymondbacteria bacterium RifOxyA12_full_50_37]|uniref:Phosphohydrolase n=1 Tax=Candidatus Raymondbacteria bacterium RIFOXYD12_FULL_49_13 TaxID=1817890 RepID=A0A1F7FJJ4_UNCRA|nr:MAG: hypothetical protein A2268_15790 [Candidatus Raymondbacteria bacterium RifOxyA12_full_50_37]OGJ87703.1 MAG: hypothetical protein A2248_07495 [Candidatus Raymondbacteria bacterium RIFOXYA2_FULL_49_16]OGJ90320.1 MAG: hypothetical protein A2350_00255 [Candidatus Raymondbacteria bacterium RifOxyB12_full_50_8]OGJ96506.1 MAG: hypothetical protein A2453_00115 [Candidatus Raymondbacteria bacterium RIFOXYC2_FULL_50_21]OGJ99702.1 MAG: hypothetical protein A2487_18665 [Candidatus Raymondbacteria b
MLDKCPGSANIRTPTLKVKQCPECGTEVELFSNEIKTKCAKCGFEIYNDIESCIKWCRYARECVGDALYEELMEKARNA